MTNEADEYDRLGRVDCEVVIITSSRLASFFLPKNQKKSRLGLIISLLHSV